MRKIKEVDLDALASSLECPAEQLERLKQATPEVFILVCVFQITVKEVVVFWVSVFTNIIFF